MTLRYSAGSDYLVVGPVGGCLTSDSTVAERVWPLVRDGESIAALLTELLSDGIALLPDFVLFEFDGPGLRAILRGSANVTVKLADGSAETCSGVSFQTWLERVFPAAISMTAGQITTPDLPLMRGVVRAGGFRFEMDSPFQPSGPSEILAETRSEVAEPALGDVFESTILRKVDGTMAEAPATPAEAVRRLGDHDGSTIMAGQLAALRMAVVPVTPPIEVAVALAPSVLVLSDGSRIPLNRAVILGRRPQVERVSSAELPYLVTVSSPNQDISRNHVQVRPGASTLLAADLHATNGTVLRRADGTVVEITNGAEMPVAIGDELELGDGVVARIEAG